MFTVLTNLTNAMEQSLYWKANSSSSCQRSHIRISVFGGERRHRVTVVLCDLFERYFVFCSHTTVNTCKTNLKGPINYVYTITYEWAGTAQSV